MTKDLGSSEVVSREGEPVVLTRRTSTRPRLPGTVVVGSLFLLLALPALRGAEPAAPRTPEDEQRAFQFADSALVVELVAAEPEVVSPVAVAWDAAGRMLVAEMRDYPNATNGGTIRLLEDRDGDGRYETSAVFAMGLSFPNSVLPWNGGVLVTAAPDLVFLRDTDGDGRADERRVLFTGFGAGNQQLRANGLAWGQDGWVYGANGRSDGAVRRPGATNAVSLRGRDFRFRPDTGAFESLAGRSQFGLALDEWGNRFLSWNTIPVRHEVFSDHYLARQPALAGVDVLVDLLPSGDGGAVHPLTPAPLVFNSESSSHFNALAGLTLYRGNALGGGYYGNTFVGESLRNLVHRRVLVSAGATFVARRAEGEEKTEFLRSSDPWFHPVNFATGPDEALYVVDFYRQFVEHPDYVPREMRDKVSWRTGSEHGRIWRVRTKAGPAGGKRPAYDLGSMKTADLAGLLTRSNRWQGETAHRLLWERNDPSAVGPLRAVVRSSTGASEGRVLALEVLARLGAVDETDLAVAFIDASPLLRARAVKLAAARLSARPSGSVMGDVILRAVTDADARVRLAAALALRELGDGAVRDVTVRRRLAVEPDHWVRLALGSSAGAGVLSKEQTAALRPSPPQSLRPAPAPVGADPDRQKVLEQFQPALPLAGDRARGATTFATLCLACHYLQGRGMRIGPDLSGIAARPPEALLADLLDPSRQVAPEYAAYEVILADGESVVGLFASESETRITLRRPGAPDENLARASVKSMRATGKSLMPDGLEVGRSPQDVADLIAFLRNPDAALLPK